MAGGDPCSGLCWRAAPLAEPMEAGCDRETFWRARSDHCKVVLAPNQDSGAQRTLAEADLLVRQRIGAPALQPGADVEVIDF